MTGILWDVQKKQETALPQSSLISQPFLQVLSLQEPFLAQKILFVVRVFTHCCEWAGSIHLHVRYAYILSLVTPLRCFLVFIFPHVKAAQRKRFQRHVAHKCKAKQSSSAIDGGNIIPMKFMQFKH